MAETKAAVQIAQITTVHSLVDNRIRHKECAGLAALGYSVALIGPGKPDIDIVEAQDAVQVYRTPYRIGRVARALRGPVDVWLRLWKLEPDVVHAHDPELIPLLILYKLIKRRTITIYDSHEDLVAQVNGKNYLSPAFRPIISAAARVAERAVQVSADVIVAATPHIASNFVSAKKVVTLQNFPLFSDYDDYRPPRPSKDVVYVGGLTRSRGSEQIIKAMELVPDDIRLKIVGPVDGDVLQAIGSSAAGIKHLGTINAKDIPAFISGGFVGLVLFLPHPNHHESQPTKLFEYLASGVPFIASDFRHWRYLTRSAECGIFVDPTSPAEIAAAITRLATDPDLCRKMGEAGRNMMMTEFSFEKELAVFVAELKALGVGPIAKESETEEG